MKELMSHYFDIEKEMNNFYEDVFESEQEEFSVNKKIKKKIVNLIADAKKNGDMKVMQKAIELISDNTGCVEDVEILNSLLKGQNDVKKEILTKSPIARWLE